MRGRTSPVAALERSPGVPGELSLRAGVPLPALRPVADFVGLPTGAGALSLASRRTIVEVAAAAWLVVGVGVAAWLAAGSAAVLTWPGVLVLGALVVAVPGARAARRAVAVAVADLPAVARVRPGTPVTVALAAPDPASPRPTLASLAAQDYGGPVRVVAVPGDLPSARAVVAAARELGLPVDVVPPVLGGDLRDAALARAATPLVLSLASGAVLHPSALRLLVARLESCPPATAAVAGHLVVRTRRTTTAAEALAEAWTLERDARERVEALLGGPLVADGSCTLFRADALRGVNAWPPAPGGDVVVTWRCLERGWAVTSEPQALAFVDAAVTATTPAEASAAASRALRVAAHESPGGASRLPGAATRVAARVDRAEPALDGATALGWLAALGLCALGQVGLVVAALAVVAPVSLAGLLIERRRHREVLDEAGLTLARRPRRWCAALVALDPVRAVLAGWGRLSAIGSRPAARPARAPTRAQPAPAPPVRRSA